MQMAKEDLAIICSFSSEERLNLKIILWDLKNKNDVISLIDHRRETTHSNIEILVFP